MATPKKGEPSKVIGSVSKFAGTLVGTAVLTGKRIIDSATPSGKGKPKKSGGKTVRAPARKKKKAVRKTKAKPPKTKKKKVVKRKKAATSGKSGASKKKRASTATKKKKSVTPRKKTTQQNQVEITPVVDIG